MGSFEKDIMNEVRRETQGFFDSFSRRYKGKPVSTVKAALAREWKSKMDGKMTDPELTDYATLISEGTRIQVK
ncbi:hypothetical protein BHE97_18560 [Aeromicrobium sp. PE09-221]|uniref:hypothetical protein n=1 Tax=Aeromicrobium sp. PE09-221 TaxID=1898043 RepID=UPI000B3E488C|nr:hypothetical protein [Aeromicrobium sp. PE09-221]OUZ06747.1 hypothetical protein BHE97_18560 [Aeromicrobium sp. PE09-221]